VWGEQVLGVVDRFDGRGRRGEHILYGATSELRRHEAALADASAREQHRWAAVEEHDPCHVTFGS
jgi:hypothetical protein